MVLAKVSFKVDVVYLDLLGEILICLNSHLATLASVILHALNILVELVLEQLDCLNWIINHKVSEFGIELSHFVQVDTEPLLSAYDTSHSFIDLCLVEIVLNKLLHSQALLILAHDGIVV